MITLPHLPPIEKFHFYAKECLEGGYQVEAADKQSFEEFFKVFEAKKRGIILYGSTGTGKSLIFDLLRRIIHPDNKEYMFGAKNVLDIVSDFNEDGHTIFRAHEKLHMLYDDLGTEKRGSHYGESIEIFELLIQFRYELFRAAGIRTYFTTNLNEQEIQMRYGERCWSRLKEMCAHLLLDGSDKRQKRNFKGFMRINHPVFKSEEDIAWEKNYEVYKKRSQEIAALKPKVPGLGERMREHFNRPKKDGTR